MTRVVCSSSARMSASKLARSRGVPLTRLAAIRAWARWRVRRSWPRVMEYRLNFGGEVATKAEHVLPRLEQLIRVDPRAGAEGGDLRRGGAGRRPWLGGGGGARWSSWCRQRRSWSRTWRDSRPPERRSAPGRRRDGGCGHWCTRPNDGAVRVANTNWSALEKLDSTSPAERSMRSGVPCNRTGWAQFPIRARCQPRRQSPWTETDRVPAAVPAGIACRDRERSHQHDARKRPGPAQTLTGPPDFTTPEGAARLVRTHRCTSSSRGWPATHHADTKHEGSGKESGAARRDVCAAGGLDP